MTSDQCNELMGRLNIIMRMLALSLITDLKRSDQMEQLSRVGFAPKEIAEIVGTTANTVSVTLSKMRKNAKTGR